MGNMGWIELVFFYGVTIGFGVWQWLKMDRMLKKTRAEREAKEAAERDGRQELRPHDRAPISLTGQSRFWPCCYTIQWF